MTANRFTAARFAIGLAATAALLVATGCGGDSDQDISASKKYGLGSGELRFVAMPSRRCALRAAAGCVQLGNRHLGDSFGRWRVRRAQ